jgi:hypothetical protein
MSFRRGGIPKKVSYKDAPGCVSKLSRIMGSLSAAGS